MSCFILRNSSVSVLAHEVILQKGNYKQKCHGYTRQLSWYWRHKLLCSNKPWIDKIVIPWNYVMTSWHGNTICVTSRWRQGPVMKSFYVSFLDKLMNKQSSCQWVEIPWHSCDVTLIADSWQGTSSIHSEHLRGIIDSFYLWLSKASSNERCYICNTSFHWMRPCLGMIMKQAQGPISQTIFPS